MKNILIVVLLIVTITSCKAQIIAVENFEDYPYELPDGAYIKDVNNVLDKYVGTWKGSYDNKNYEFRIIKFTEVNTKYSLNYKEDMLLMRYKITSSSGTVLANTLSLPNDSPYIIRGDYLAKSGPYVLGYVGLQGDCGQNGNIFMSVYNTTETKMKLFLNVHGEMSECTTGPAPQIIPTDWIDLTSL